MKRLIMAAAFMLLAGAAYAQDEDSQAQTWSTFNAGVAAVIFRLFKGDPSFQVEDSTLGLTFYALGTTEQFMVWHRRRLLQQRHLQLRHRSRQITVKRSIFH